MGLGIRIHFARPPKIKTYKGAWALVCI